MTIWWRWVGAALVMRMILGRLGPIEGTDRADGGCDVGNTWLADWIVRTGCIAMATQNMIYENSYRLSLPSTTFSPLHRFRTDTGEAAKGIQSTQAVVLVALDPGFRRVPSPDQINMSTATLHPRQIWATHGSRAGPPLACRIQIQSKSPPGVQLPDNLYCPPIWSTLGPTAPSHGTPQRHSRPVQALRINTPPSHRLDMSPASFLA